MASRNWQNIFLKGQGFSEQAITQFSSLEVDVATALAYVAGGSLSSLGWLDAKAGYGAVGDGVTDDTVALQAWITAVVTGGKTGYLPTGTYKITAALNFPRRPGWRIIGANRYLTTIKQATSNTAIFNLGSDTASSMHSWGIENLSFDYSVSQASANTSAVCILFSQEAYHGQVRNLSFVNGAYGIAVATGITCPWGNSWDDLDFGTGLTVAALNMIPGVSGCPNNHFGRLFADATNMIGPVFGFRGYNCQIDTIEVIQANQGAKILTTSSDSELTIGALKLENGSYSASQSLFEFTGDANAQIGTIVVGGSSLPLSGAATVVSALVVGGGGTGKARVNVGLLDVAASSVAGGAVGYAVLCDNSGFVTLGSVTLGTGFTLNNVGSTSTMVSVSVADQVNGKLSDNKGNADYTVAQGDPNIISFETAFTAPRTVNLPATLNNQWTGLTYRVRSYGAVNGANTLLVKCNAVTLATIAADKTILTFTCARRSGANPQTNWLITGSETLP